MYGNDHQNRKDTLTFKNGCSLERQLSVKKMGLRNACEQYQSSLYHKILKIYMKILL